MKRTLATLAGLLLCLGFIAAPAAQARPVLRPTAPSIVPEPGVGPFGDQEYVFCPVGYMYVLHLNVRQAPGLSTTPYRVIISAYNTVGASFGDREFDYKCTEYLCSDVRVYYGGQDVYDPAIMIYSVAVVGYTSPANKPPMYDLSMSRCIPPILPNHPA